MQAFKKLVKFLDECFIIYRLRFQLVIAGFYLNMKEKF